MRMLRIRSTIFQSENVNEPGRRSDDRRGAGPSLLVCGSTDGRTLKSSSLGGHGMEQAHRQQRVYLRQLAWEQGLRSGRPSKRVPIPLCGLPTPRSLVVR